jgi:hypothetical protein
MFHVEHYSDFPVEGRASCCRRSTRPVRSGRRRTRRVRPDARTCLNPIPLWRRRTSRAAGRAACCGTLGIAPFRCHTPALRRNGRTLCRCIRKSASLAPWSRHESASLFKIRVWATRKPYFSRTTSHRAASCAADTCRRSPDFSFCAR